MMQEEKAEKKQEEILADNAVIYCNHFAQNICITFIQRRPNVFDAGPTLYKCYANVLCLLASSYCCLPLY